MRHYTNVNNDLCLPSPLELENEFDARKDEMESEARPQMFTSQVVLFREEFL